MQDGGQTIQGVGCPSEGGGQIKVGIPLTGVEQTNRESFRLGDGSGEDWARTPRGRDLSACQPAQLCGNGSGARDQRA